MGGDSCTSGASSWWLELKSDIIFMSKGDTSMIVCLCEGMNDTALRQVIREGCATVTDIARRTRAGSHCGACGCDLKRLLAEEAQLDEAEAELEVLSIAAK